ncbi:hypothetical protein [Streptomyces sp. NPDC012888]|uniref:hypothetical protein n=1 Tax=Streptomyces sp. NPDC012888 TaxID=3364855 RepID=UPI0036A7A17C
MTKIILEPGLTTTREQIAQTFGGSKYSGGIVPAKASGMVFVFSDPAAGAKHGYTFDGQADDDEYGTLYMYTGAGGEGDQDLVRGNKVLHDTLRNGREVHLFVADGRVAGSATVLQRYVGQVVVDPIQPFVERRAPDQQGELRRVLVFRLRAAQGQNLLLTEKDAMQPATKTTVLDMEPAAKLGVLPAQVGVTEKNTEQHVTGETTANVAGGIRRVMRREGVLVKAFEEHLAQAGHSFKSFQITVAGEPGVLTPDLYDQTDHVLYEAKGQASRNNVRMAIGQLADYRRHIPGENTLRTAVLLPDEPTPDVKDLLAARNIALIYQTEDGFSGFPLQSSG